MESNRKGREMQATPYADKIDPDKSIRQEVALRLEAAILDWQEGRNASPDERDYVIYTREILERRLGDAFIGTTPEGEELVADALYEIQCGDAETQLATFSDLADYLVDCLVAE